MPRSALLHPKTEILAVSNNLCLELKCSKRKNRAAAKINFATAPLRWVRIPPTCVKKQRHQKVSLFLAEDEGFEPPQTESESGVLPLHKSSICPSLVVAHKQHGYYTTQSQKVKHYFPVFQKNFSADPFCALA